MGRNASCAHGERPQVLSHFHLKWYVRFSTGGMRKSNATQRALCLPNWNVEYSCLL